MLWIKLCISKSSLIVILNKHNFVFHHCNEEDITLVKKLIPKPIIPTAKNHTLGVGAVVINKKKLLVIKDRFNLGYKLPGGHIDNNENITTALKREVLEETGISVEFVSIVNLGHFTKAQFGESNLYILCTAKPLSYEINIQDTQEIIEAKWIDIDEFLKDNEVHEYNKHIVKSALNNKGLEFQKNKLILNKQNQLFF